MGAGKRTKLVPEWLNNPLWSSPPPSAAAVAAAQPAPALARYESPPRAPPPLPPPQTESSMPPPQPARGVKSEAAEEASPSGASRAEESIQSHLLAEFKLMVRVSPSPSLSLSRDLSG